ncbi:MAG: HTH-type transcriptional regulator DmlR [Burkholderiaceae bacterium]|nr:HTH-type transcriptional regulator DmlR [Burkholderiaceae bacterium]
MNWDDYDVFCRVIEHGGFSAAARVIDRPRSSVSASVMRLEHELRTRLLERTTRHVRLTEAGAGLYRRIGPLFAQLRDARSEAAALEETVRGTLRMASPYEFGAHHLAPVACDMMARYPELVVQIDVEHAVVNPLERPCDIVFSMVEREALNTGTIARRVFSLQQGLFAAPALLERHPVPERPEALSELPLLATSDETTWGFVGPAGESITLAVVTPKLRSANAEVRLRAALAGLGVLHVTATYCERQVETGTLRTLLPDYACTPRHVYALLPSQRHPPAKVRLFLDALSARLPS